MNGGGLGLTAPLIVYLLLMAQSVPIHAQPVNRRFEVRFDRVVSDESGEEYFGLTSNGPYFVDESTFVVLAAKGQLKCYSLSEGTEVTIAIPKRSPTLLYRTGDRVYLQAGELLYQCTGRDLLPAGPDIRITPTVVFNTIQGLLEQTSAGRRPMVAIEEFLFPETDRTFVTLPAPNAKRDALFYLTSYKEQPFVPLRQLVRYDVRGRTKKQLLGDVCSFCLIPNAPDLILVFAQYGKFGCIPSEFNGDFGIIDQRTGAFVQIFDAEDYHQKREFLISSFDINARGNIVALGSYFDCRDAENPNRYAYVLLLSLVERTE